jgi:hypothetical protein
MPFPIRPPPEGETILDLSSFEGDR